MNIKDIYIGILLGVLFTKIVGLINRPKHFYSQTILTPTLKTDCEENKCDTVYLYEFKR